MGGIAAETGVRLSSYGERGYAEKYRADTRPIHEIGIVFDPETRNIKDWETEWPTAFAGFSLWMNH
jgi:hypothetical protein